MGLIKCINFGFEGLKLNLLLFSFEIVSFFFIYINFSLQYLQFLLMNLLTLHTRSRTKNQE